MFYVYFIKSKRNGKIYTGVTSKDPKTRLAEHNYGTNQWTKQNGPFELCYYESYYCVKDAQNREKFYKTGFGKQIKKIIVDKLSGCGSVSSKGRPAFGWG